MTEPVQFATVGFYEAMADALNNDPIWAEKSAGLTMSMVYTYEGSQPGSWYMEFDGGKVHNVRDASDADREQADYVISGPSEIWREVFQGDKSPAVAMARGLIKIKGDAKALVKNLGTFKYVLDAMGKIPYV
jgi:putative sterol carrier protein